jgi:hypothetical protein
MNFSVNYLNAQGGIVHKAKVSAPDMVQAIPKGLEGVCEVKKRQVKRTVLKRLYKLFK